MKAAFGQPGFRLLFGGLLASMVGDSLMLIVLAIWVKELTGSNGAAGLTFFFLALPTLVAPVFGLLVDRFKRRTLLFWGNLASALAVAPLLFVDDASDLWIVYLVAMLYGVSFIVLPAGLNGLLKEMLPEDLLVDANASLATSKEALRLVGPLVGAGLYTALGGASVAVIDAATFVIAAVTIRVLKVPEEVPVREETRFRDEVLAGIRHIRHNRVLLHTLITLGSAVLVIGFMESAVFAMVDVFGKPASYVGVIVSVQGVGAILGGLTSSWLLRRIGEVRGIAIGLALLALGLAVCAASTQLSVVFVGVVVLGYSLPVLLVAFYTLMQKQTPNRLMGRVSAAAEVMIGTPQALSIAAGALLVSLISYRTIYGISAVVIVACAAYLVWVLRGEAHVATQTQGEPAAQGLSSVPDAVVTPATVGIPPSARDGATGDHHEDGCRLEPGRDR